MSRAASIAGFEDPLGDDNDCGICLEADLDVAINGCKHRLCIDCSIRSGLHSSCLPQPIGYVPALLTCFTAPGMCGKRLITPLTGSIMRIHKSATVSRVVTALYVLHISVRMLGLARPKGGQQRLCERRLCEVTKKPPLCPFCRNFIEGFHALQSID